MYAAAFGSTTTASATQGDPLIAGTINTETSATSVSNTGAGDGLVAQGADGRGLRGTEGFACSATSYPPCAGVFGEGDHAGVVGNGLFDGVGVEGDAFEQPGVLGQGQPGVEGVGDLSGASSVGVKGTSPDPSGTGVIAEATAGGTALQVTGPAVFSRSGFAIVTAGNDSVEVQSMPLTATSLVLAVLQVNRPGVIVRAVVPHIASSSFTIWLNRSSIQNVRVAWFIVN
jgi:hypothetical protein